MAPSCAKCYGAEAPGDIASTPAPFTHIGLFQALPSGARTASYLGFCGMRPPFTCSSLLLASLAGRSVTFSPVLPSRGAGFGDFGSLVAMMMPRGLMV